MMEIRELIEAYKCGYEDAVRDFQKKEEEKKERLLKTLEASDLFKPFGAVVEKMAESEEQA